MTNSVLLKMALVRNGITVLDLCEKCGFSSAYYYKCLRGEQDFRTDEVRAICTALNIGTDEMAAIFFDADAADMSTRTN